VILCIIDQPIIGTGRGTVHTFQAFICIKNGPHSILKNVNPPGTLQSYFQVISIPISGYLVPGTINPVKPHQWQYPFDAE
jgi:hypothetical protein